MNNVIVGTAGHVDHGKTCLIEALSGFNTDRLKEEKERGITIDLGFAEITNGDDIRIGVIDVPGHEKFIKNMLAGIGGIDYVLFVVAADEGIKPQSLEHLRILESLGIEEGIIVLTKVDLVDGEWIDLVKEDIRDTVKGTFLEKVEILEVSVKDNLNIETLKKDMFEMAGSTGKRRIAPELTRLFIDRVFTIGGFGTVITGTLNEGCLRPGDKVKLYPKNEPVKIRSVQVHGKNVEEAVAGQRTALNISNLKKDELKRGDVLAADGSLVPGKKLDVKISVFPDVARDILNNSRVHFYCGSTETLAKVILMDKESLGPGEEGFAQLRFEEDITFRRNDPFILRFFSPVETIAGGTIIDADPVKHKRYDDEVIDYLTRCESKTGPDAVALMLLYKAPTGKSITDIAYELGATSNEVRGCIDDLTEKKIVLEVDEDLYLHDKIIKKLCETVKDIITVYTKKNPLSGGIPVVELRSRLGSVKNANDPKFSASIIKYLIRQNCLTENDGKVNIKGAGKKPTAEQQKVMDQLASECLSKGFEGLNISEAENKPGLNIRQVVDALEAVGVLLKLKYPCYIHIEYWNRALDIVRSHFVNNDSITLGEFRDQIGTSRKYAMMLLDAMDEQKITRLEGDYRILL